jgi:phage FluMu protein Com
MFQKITMRCPHCDQVLQAWYETGVDDLTCPWCRCQVPAESAPQNARCEVQTRPSFWDRLRGRVAVASGLSCNGSLL